MDDVLIQRVKSSLNKRFYTMNDSWLTDCVEYYLNDHVNPTQEEIITFVMNQWVLCDLREINNENGCLPRNLANQKCTTLSGKYILQMDKMYDISVSKYKQLEKIRNVSSENVEVTENENATQEDKFQNWETKSKRMLQLFLTDGVQDILAIEYKPIRFLKDNLFPGFKLLIKGPVICRRGVILLEETNLSEIGGEVDSLLIVNAVENVFARALNLEENPDPYNDNNKQSQNSQNSQNTKNIQNVINIEDDFDMDTEVIDQIEKQIQQQNSNSSKNSITSTRHEQQRQIHEATNKRQKQNVLSDSKNQNVTTSSTRTQQSNSEKMLNTHLKPQKQNNNSNIQKQVFKFDNDDDSFLEEIDDRAFTELSKSEPVSTVKNKSTTNKQTPTTLQNNDDEFPTEDEVLDFEDYSPFFDASKQQPSKTKLDLSNKPSTSKTVTNSRNSSYTSEKLNKKNTVTTNISKDNSNKKQLISPTPAVNVRPSINNASEFPDDDFDFNDFDIKLNNLDDYHNKNNITEENDKNSSHQSSSNLSRQKNDVTKKENSSISSSTTKFEECNSLQNFETEFENEIDIEFEDKMDLNYKKSNSQQNKKIEVNNKTKSKDRTDNNSSTESTGLKRLASIASPCKDAPQKQRCLQNIQTVNKASDRKITDFLSKPSLLHEDIPKVLEFICDIIKESQTDQRTRTVVRGKVVNVIKLNLLKEATGLYFHLEGTITDKTANLDVVFSSEVLEKIIGYSPQEFSQKRKKSKTDPKVKEQLREDLKKAQETLIVMDVLMEVELKKDKKALIVNTLQMTKEQIVSIENRIKLLKIKKYT